MCITVDILQYSMPLAFLPSVLEDRGHSTFKIASAIGVYYWTGFAGGLCITTYQIGRLLCSCGERAGDITTLSTVKMHLKFLIVGLFVGTVTLTCQALFPYYNVHLWCRFVQGFAGAFIFFYAFLLSVALFQANSEQQDFAMTTAATALNVAEVLGSLFGALIYEVWGQRTVFWFLGVASVINQFLLCAVIASLNSVGEHVVVPPTTISMQNMTRKSGWRRVWNVLSSRRLGCAVLLIVMAAVVKGAVEEMLPFHADHQWGFSPLEIGQLFAIIAFTYIVSALSVGKAWRWLDAFRVYFSAFWLALLGLSALLLFSLSAWNMGKLYLWGALAFYGMCLGLTHTPAALLLADAIEHEEGVAKDAVNGVWNTMWEAGGSLGFLLGGLLAHHYADQVRLLMGTSIACVVAALLLCFLAMGIPLPSKLADAKEKEPLAPPPLANKKPGYGGGA
jgi:MFS family permease